jgi:hypothetical protein
MGGNSYEMIQQHSGDDPSRHITGSKRGDLASLEVLFRSVTHRRDGDLPNAATHAPGVNEKPLK